MAIVKTWGYTDSKTSEYTVHRPNLDYANDFAIAEDEAGRTVITNITSPIDQPETIRYQYQNVANIYANSGIDPSLMSQNKTGFSVVVQVNDTLRVSDDSEGSIRTLDLPCTAHLVFKFPKSQYIGSTEIETVIARTIGALASTDSASLSSHINALARSATRPAEM